MSALGVLRKRPYRVHIQSRRRKWEPRRVLSVDVAAGTRSCRGNGHEDIRRRGNQDRRHCHISQEDLELDRLVLSRFEGSETIANAAFRTLVDRYGGRPLAEYASAPQEIDLN